MTTASELLRFAAFAELPADQIEWFLGQSKEVGLKAAEIFVRQGDPPDAMFVILEGDFEWRGEFNGETVVFPGKVGDVTGALPFSRMKQFMVTGRAVTDGRILRFPASLCRAHPKNAGTAEALGWRDDRPSPRGHSHRTAARPSG